MNWWKYFTAVRLSLCKNRCNFFDCANRPQALAGLVEIPAIGIAMYIIMKTGKKWLFFTTFLSTGISCFFAAIFEGNGKMLWLKITFVMIGKGIDEIISCDFLTKAFFSPKKENSQ